METEVSRKGSVVIVSAGDRLDSNSSAAFQERLNKVIENEPSIVVDMSRFNYVSSAGLRVLLMAAKQCKAANRKLALCGLQPDVHMVFDISGFLPLFSIFADTNEAVTALS